MSRKEYYNCKSNIQKIQTTIHRFVEVSRACTSLNDFRQSSISAGTQQTPFEETGKDKKKGNASNALPNSRS